MSATITQVKENLSAMLHGGTLNKVRNIESLLERSANILLSKINPIETIRVSSLPNVVHDDVYNYSFPQDFMSLIDIYPQDNRQTHDSAGLKNSEYFDVRKSLENKTLSIEGSDGSKMLRVNWRSRQGKVLHAMNSVTANGTWSAVGTATNIEADTIFKKSGNASIKFDVSTSGDGIQNTGISALDLTDEDEVADIFIWVYLPSAPTSVSVVWGNDLVTNYWTSTAVTTQFDGTAFKVGWNLLKFSWATATETGTVTPSTVDSFKITIVNSTAMSNVRVDNIIFSIGRNFDIKYYSKYILKNSSGVWIPRTTSDDDVVVLDNDAIEIFNLENLIQAAHQIEGSDSTFDINYATKKLNGDLSSRDPKERLGLYGCYRAEHPSQAKKTVGYYGGRPGRGRW